MNQPNASLPLLQQLALTVASVCACRHGEWHHGEDKACRFCECGEYRRDTTHDALVYPLVFGQAA